MLLLNQETDEHRHCIGE